MATSCCASHVRREYKHIKLTKSTKYFNNYFKRCGWGFEATRKTLDAERWTATAPQKKMGHLKPESADDALEKPEGAGEAGAEAGAPAARLRGGHLVSEAAAGRVRCKRTISTVNKNKQKWYLCCLI